MLDHLPVSDLHVTTNATVLIHNALLEHTAVTNAKRLVRADGHGVPAILEAILQLFPLDSYVEKPAAVMRRVDKPGEPAPIWNEYQRLLDSAEGRHIAIEQIERFAFYDRARQTFGVLATGETALYGNLIIKKGVIAPS